MKIQLLILSLFLCCGAFAVEKAPQGKVRITSGAVVVANDSLYLDWVIDLREVAVSAGYSRIFIPMLRAGRHTLHLPSVVVAGVRREKAEGRKQALRLEEPAVPYMKIRYTKRYGARLVHYKVALPYAYWMARAELVLHQVYRDCCTETVLSSDVLATDVVPVPAPYETPVPSHTLAPATVSDSFPTQLLVSTGNNEQGAASFINSASAALVLGDVVLARAYLKQAGKDPRTYNNRGVVYSMEKNKAMAARFFRKALLTEPEAAGENLARLEEGRP